MLELLDFLVRVNVDAREKLGEDSWCHAFAQDAGLLAVFDGCGGSGARQHACYSGHSEAYMASRLCAGALYDAFRDVPGEAALERFAQYCQASFAAYRPESGQSSRIRSSMITTLPTTMAAAFVHASGENLCATAAWAGDSRVYVLAPAGLSQLSTDDSEDDDPFVTDGMMTNTLNADRAPRIRRRDCTLALPALVLAATDGCFAYYTTPMEFEGVLLSTLLSADNPAQWEQALAEQIGKVAGDDYTLALASFGFGSFARLQKAFLPRYRQLCDEYLNRIVQLPPEDAASRRALWERYRPEYVKYLEG